MTTGIFFVEWVRRILCLLVIGVLVMLMDINEAFFTFLMVIPVLGIFISSYTMVSYESTYLKITNNYLLGFYIKTKTIKLDELKEIRYDDFGAQLSSHFMNFFSKGSPIKIEPEMMEWFFKDGKKDKIKLNLNISKLNKVLNQVQEDWNILLVKRELYEK